MSAYKEFLVLSAFLLLTNIINISYSNIGNLNEMRNQAWLALVCV